MVQTQERDCAKEMVSVQVCVHCGILKVGREGEMKRLGFSSLFHPSPICLLSPSPPHLLHEARTWYLNSFLVAVLTHCVLPFFDSQLRTPALHSVQTFALLSHYKGTQLTAASENTSRPGSSGSDAGCPMMHWLLGEA